MSTKYNSIKSELFKSGKNIFQYFIQIIDSLVFVIPTLVVVLVGIKFISDLFCKPRAMSQESYSIFIAGIGLTATLSSLAFRAGSSSEENEKKRKYYKVGEGFLLSVVFFILAFITKYAISNFFIVGQLSKTGNFIYGVLDMTQTLLFLGAFLLSANALQDLQDILTGFTKKYLKNKNS